MLRAALVATLAGALTLGAAGWALGDEASAVPAGKQRHQPDRGRKVTFEAPGAAVPTILTPNCNPTDPADCILPTNYPPTEVTGDVRGTAFSSTVVIGRNGVYPAASLDAFVGRVRGCGTGGLVIIVEGSFDPSTGLTTGKWHVHEDAGTGDLADVSGGGTTRFDQSGGRFEGRLRCR
jgi:hypothetical protein